MPDSIAKIVQRMQANPGNISFSGLCKVCDYYFGKPRQDRSSHRIYKMPWPGDPRINIQNDKGKAKAYQVKQVLKAISKLEAQDGNKTDETN
ncbi:MAG: toxin HicA [Dehalococcoidia bacterium]|nr:toxin HicA [Dehalococcoidia bacterium]